MPGKTVMIVEDDSGLREALCKVLTASGFGVTAFASAEECLEATAARRVSCLVADIRLPGATGLDLYRSLEGRGPAPPVIFMTAFDEPHTREEAARLGARAYLVKPFRGKELAEAVTQALVNGAASFA